MNTDFAVTFTPTRLDFYKPVKTWLFWGELSIGEVSGDVAFSLDPDDPDEYNLLSDCCGHPVGFTRSVIECRGCGERFVWGGRNVQFRTTEEQPLWGDFCGGSEYDGILLESTIEWELFKSAAQTFENPPQPAHVKEVDSRRWRAEPGRVEFFDYKTIDNNSKVCQWDRDLSPSSSEWAIVGSGTHVDNGDFPLEFYRWVVAHFPDSWVT